jgi:adenylylsulfate kinase
MIYWFTGQPGAGKTTLAKYLVKFFPQDSVFHIDGDDLREIYKDVDFSEEGRRKNIQRAQDLARFLSIKGYQVIVSLVSPYLDQRESFKDKNDVMEIYVHTTEDRGRNNYHVQNYEKPIENYVNIDTTIDSETDSYYKLLKYLNL